MFERVFVFASVSARMRLCALYDFIRQASELSGAAVPTRS